MEGLPFGLRQAAERLHVRWTELRPSVRVVLGIIGVNTGVFMLWRLPLLRVRTPHPQTAPDRPAVLCARLAFDSASPH